MNKSINVDSADHYFSLPKKEREYKFLGIFNFYKTPYALPWERFSIDESGWTSWEKRIKEEYPAQWFFREYLLSHDFPIYRFFSIQKRRFENFYYKIKCIFKPYHKRFRKVGINLEYSDISELMNKSMFALLCDFREEAANSLVDWEKSGKTDFIQKLNEYADWIEIKEKVLIDQTYELMDKGVEDFKINKDYSMAYKPLHDLEKHINGKYDEIMKWMIENKENFWT